MRTQDLNATTTRDTARRGDFDIAHRVARLIRITHVGAFALVSVVALSGCPPPTVDTERAPVTFKVPGASPGAFLDTPWPSDLLLRRDDDGKPSGIDLRAIPNPTQVTVLEDYLALFQSVPGYSASGTLYFHVDGGILPSSLSSPEESLLPSASIFLMDVGDSGRRWPIEFTTYDDATTFLPAGTVAVRPLLGAVPSGRIALVVTSAATNNAGVKLGPSDDLKKLMLCDDGDQFVDVDCAPYAAVLEKTGRAIDDVALIQMVTVTDSATELARLADHVKTLPPPTIVVTTRENDRDQYDVYRGVVDLVSYQAGSPPYASFDGVTGGIFENDDGTFDESRTETVEFILTVPKSAAPSAGFPVVIYGHGTGGDLESGLGNSPSAEAHQLARAGAAMLATSEPLHFGRTGYTAGSEEILTFNFLNPVAGRDGWRQSVIEKVQLRRAIENLSVDPAISGAGRIMFDDENVAFFGHSQGGNVGGVLAGVDDAFTGIFLSGAGGGFGPAVAAKTEPVDIPTVLKTLLALPDDENIDDFHLIITLLQLWIDPADPISYGARWQAYDDTRPHFVATSGLEDEFTPASTHAGLAGAFGVPLVEPASTHFDVLKLLGLGEGPTNEAVGNLVSSSGRKITGAMLQYENEGHFAVFYNPHAQDSYRQFFSTLFSDPAPRARTLLER